MFCLFFSRWSGYVSFYYSRIVETKFLIFFYAAFYFIAAFVSMYNIEFYDIFLFDCFNVNTATDTSVRSRSIELAIQCLVDAHKMEIDFVLSSANIQKVNSLDLRSFLFLESFAFLFTISCGIIFFDLSYPLLVSKSFTHFLRKHYDIDQDIPILLGMSAFDLGMVGCVALSAILGAYANFSIFESEDF